MKTRLGTTLATIFLCFIAVKGSHGQNPANTASVIFTEHGANTAGAQAAPYVVLVSLDGFRWDYPREYNATNLQHVAMEGASAPEGMIPSFPSLTFPNHYTIVTGLYPGHHGIVANSFYDPVRQATYSYTDAKTNGEGAWYRGVPLWSLAEKQGMRSACFFWPASNAEIAGERPTYYLNYDGAVPNEQRAQQVVDWLKLPAAQRPHFITLYFSDVDHMGHVNGPDSPEVGEAVHQLDSIVGKLESDLKQLPLRVDLIIVADHGMVAREGDWIDLDRYADLSQFKTVNSLLYAPDDAAAAKAYRQLRGASDKFKVYRRSELPARLHLTNDPREGDPVVIPTGPYVIRGHATETPEKPPTNKGEHGYDPRQMKQMRPIFFAEGPDIRAGYLLKPFENVDIYPLIAQILGLQIGKIDGNAKVLRGMLRGHQDIQSVASVHVGQASRTNYFGTRSTSSAAQ
jgi:predicted AlkP superfamily pyrophosphatase or phosphodiesterase